MAGQLLQEMEAVDVLEESAARYKRFTAAWLKRLPHPHTQYRIEPATLPRDVKLGFDLAFERAGATIDTWRISRVEAPEPALVIHAIGVRAIEE